MHPTTLFQLRRIAPFALLAATACLSGSGQEPTPVASRIELVRGDAQSDTVDQPLPVALQVRVLDQNDQPMAGVPVRFIPDPGAGTVLVKLGTTDISGVLRTSWRMPIVSGTYRVRAEVAGVGGVDFHGTAVADRVQSLVRIAGNGQSGEVGKPLGERIVVRAIDRFGNGVSGVPIGFTVPSGNGRVLVPLASSNASGDAETTWELGSVPGAMVMRAKAPNIQSVPFDATALPPAP